MRLFNLNDLVTENFNIVNLVRESNSNEVYLHSALAELSTLNESVNGSIKKLYKSVLEAESKSEENCYFCEMFKEFKCAIFSFSKKITEMVGRFNITIENIVDANRDLIDTDFIAELDDELTSRKFTAMKYKNLTANYPAMDPIGAYKKEFDKIGSLMQNIGNLASNEVKLKVIASVYNDFSKELNSAWTDKCIAGLIGDEYNSENYAEVMYNYYRGEKAEIELSKSTLYNAKAVLMNYKQLTGSVTDYINTIINEFEKIANDVESMVYRNEDYKLKINTDTDGIQNRDYQLDVYSTNQLNIFMKAKISQIIELCNLYTIAISMKLDAVKEYIIQNKNILSEVQGIKTVDDRESEGETDINGIEDTSDDDTQLDDNTQPDDDTQLDDEESSEQPDESTDDDPLYGNEDNESSDDDIDSEDDSDEEDSDEDSDDDGFYNDGNSDNEPTTPSVPDPNDEDKEPINEEDPEEIEERAGYLISTLPDRFKNLLANANSTGNYSKIQPGILNMIKKCKTLKDIKEMKTDIKGHIPSLEKRAKNTEYAIKHPEDPKYKKLVKYNDKGCTPKAIRDHIKWLKSEAIPALAVKEKEIKANQKATSEAVDLSSSMNDLEKEVYFFEYCMFNLDRIMEQEDIMCSIKEALMLEDGEQQTQSDNNNNSSTSALSSLAKDAKGIDIIEFIFAQIENITNKFKSGFIGIAKKRSDEIKKYETNIIGKNAINIKNFPNSNDVKFYALNDPAGINDFKIEDFKWDDNGDNSYLDSQEAYLKQYYNSIIPDGKLPENTTLATFVTGRIIDTKSDQVQWSQRKSKSLANVKAMYNYVTEGYLKDVNKLGADYKNIIKAKSKLTQIAKLIDKQAAQAQQNNNNNQNQQQNNQNNNDNQNTQNNNNNQQSTGESFSYKSTMQMYFNEFTASGDSANNTSGDNNNGNSQQQSGDNSKGKTDTKKKLKLYLNINSTILSAQMSALHKSFMETYSALKWFAKKNNAKIEPNNNNSDNNNNSNNNDTNKQ